MSYEEMPFGRERNPQIDFIKLQLLNTLNQLRLESMLQKVEHGKKTGKFFADTRELNEEVTFAVATMKDRVDYLLEIAKNLLRDEDDPKNEEYHKFENMAISILNIKLLKRKKLGIQTKRL